MKDMIEYFVTVKETKAKEISNELLKNFNQLKRNENKLAKEYDELENYFKHLQTQINNLNDLKNNKEAKLIKNNLLF